MLRGWLSLFFLLSQSLPVTIATAFVIGRRNHPPSSPAAGRSYRASSSPLDGLFSLLAQPSTLTPPPEILAGTSIDPARDDVDLVRVYKATKDGWSAINFHEKVDGKGSAIVIAKSTTGKVFGGYNPLGWMSTDDYGNSNSAFLWFRTSSSSSSSSGGGGGIGKCPILTGGNAAIFDYATGGPNFGACDLCLGQPRAAVLGGFAGPNVEDSESVAGDLRRGKSNVGGAYDYVRGWPVAGEFRLSEVEVWCNANAGRRTRYGGGGGGGGGGGLFGY
ncbi:hypothetical protein ACHAXA_010905 [Cyclostephanos tholiformis]|uniref:TLDc domain-containing protein n=1 Tax=Cyclostephanos tholiformis TaxID=382380 RepID=A0ABD3R7Q3_9STRA